LSNSAIKYAALSNTSHEIWREYGATTQGHIATLNLLRMVQMRPLLLSILDTLSIPEGKKSIKYLVDCAVRILIVGGRGGTVEATYCDAAKAIRENIRDASSVRAALNTIFPADTEFRNAFSIATVSKAYLARYYLRAIEQSSNGNSHPEFVPNPNAEDINLEHVIPLHPGQNWTHLSEDECKALYRRLGNMALLQSNINATTGNAAFPDKKGVLTQSSYELTKDIAKCRNWAALEVAERQNKLAELAVKTWSGKFS
jgi:hypothetical protein